MRFQRSVVKSAKFVQGGCRAGRTIRIRIRTGSGTRWRRRITRRLRMSVIQNRPSTQGRPPVESGSRDNSNECVGAHFLTLGPVNNVTRMPAKRWAKRPWAVIRSVQSIQIHALPLTRSPTFDFCRASAREWRPAIIGGTDRPHAPAHQSASNEKDNKGPMKQFVALIRECVAVQYARLIRYEILDRNAERRDRYT